MQVQCSRWYVLRPEITIPGDPSTQQIANLIQYGVAIGVTPTYNTTNTLNESLSHRFIGNVLHNETVQTSLFFRSFIVHTTPFCFASK